MFVRSLRAAAVVLLIGASPILAQGTWVGKTVFTKASGTIRINGVGPVGKKVTVPLTRITYRVLMEKDGQIQIHDNGVDGWAGKGLFVPSEDAVTYYTGRIKGGAKLGWLYGYRAEAHQLAGNNDKALADLTEAVRLDPKQSVWWSNRAGLWLRQKDYDKALADANKAIHINPNSAHAFRNRGAAEHGKKRYKEAAADFSEAIAIDPSRAEYFSSRALAWWSAKDYDKAIADFDAALRIHPENVLDLVDRGRLLAMKKDYDKAIADFNAALKVNPRHAATLRHRARAWQGKKEYGKAIADLDRATEIDPGDLQAINSLAWLLATCASAEHRDGKRAVEVATEACKLTEFKDGNCLDTLAAACAEAGQFDAAVRYQEKALRDPSFAEQSVGGRMRLELYKNRKAFHAD